MFAVGVCVCNMLLFEHTETKIVCVDTDRVSLSLCGPRDSGTPWLSQDHVGSPSASLHGRSRLYVESIFVPLSHRHPEVHTWESSLYFWTGLSSLSPCGHLKVHYCLFVDVDWTSIDTILTLWHPLCLL